MGDLSGREWHVTFKWECDCLEAETEELAFEYACDMIREALREEWKYRDDPDSRIMEIGELGNG